MKTTIKENGNAPLKTQTSLQKATPPTSGTVKISAPNFRTIGIPIVGTSPLMQLRFSAKVMDELKKKMEAGSTAKTKKKRTAKNFDKDVEEAVHRSTEGWIGIPATAFRNAAIRAGKLVGMTMTDLRMSIFIEQDGIDDTDSQPLVKLIAGDYEKTIMPVRNATGVIDLRARPMWKQWAVNLRVTYDADMFTVTDVANLITRAGLQVGVGEGRPFSKKSNGMGYGQFRVEFEKLNKEQ